MATFTIALRELTQERDRTQQNVEKLDQAIAVIKQLLGKNGSHNSASTARRQTRMSAAGRARIAAAQRARWAKFRAQSGRTASASKPQRVMSASARRRIAAAQRARWAKVKAGQSQKAA